MQLFVIILLIILFISIIFIYIKLYNQYAKIHNDYIDQIHRIENKYKLIIDILEKHKLDLTSLLTFATDHSNHFYSLKLNNNVIEEYNNLIENKIDKLDKFVNNLQLDINNLQLDINNKHDNICDNKLNKIILNTNTVKECVELISNNTDKLMKSLEAKNSLCKRKTNKSSSKKKKEEKQADNS